MLVARITKIYDWCKTFAKKSTVKDQKQHEKGEEKKYFIGITSF